MWDPQTVKLGVEFVSEVRRSDQCVAMHEQLAPGMAAPKPQYFSQVRLFLGEQLITIGTWLSLAHRRLHRNPHADTDTAATVEPSASDWQ